MARGLEDYLDYVTDSITYYQPNTPENTEESVPVREALRKALISLLLAEDVLFSEVSEKLKLFGIDVKDKDKNIKRTYDVLKELSYAWDTAVYNPLFNTEGNKE